MNAEQIPNIQLAEIMAYAEKPYRDIMVAEHVSDHESAQLNDLANYAGYVAGKQYIENLTINIDQFIPLPSLESQPETTPINEQTTKLDQKLDMKIADFIGDDKLHKMKIRNALSSHGITTVRDVLVVGKWTTESIPNIGNTSMNILHNRMDSEFGDQVVWKEELTFIDVAELCDSLDQVPSLVLPGTLRGAYILLKTYRSVKSIINVNLDDLEAVLYTSDINRGGSNRERAVALKEEARNYEEGFRKAKYNTRSSK